MRIGIDACCWSNRRGFGRFTRELVARMVADFPRHEYTLVVDDRTAAGSAFPPRARVEVVRTRKQPTEAASAEGARSPWDLWRLSRATSRLPVDVFFFPAVYSFYPLLRRIPLVVAFHDAIAETHPNLIFPGWRARTLWGVKTWLARKQAERLMTVSASAKARLAATFGYPESRIHVVTEGPSDAFRPMEDREAIGRVLARYHLPAERPLILYVGGIMVLFLFVIMLVNLEVASHEKRFNSQKWIAGACVLAMSLQAAWFVAQGAGRFKLAQASAAVAPEGLGNSEQISRVLFSQYLLPFELASILLLVAIIGAVVMAKKRI